MAVTQYHIYCRYFNGNMNKCVTNSSKSIWVSKYEMEELTEFYNNNKTRYKDILDRIANGSNHVFDLSVDDNEIYTKCTRYETLMDAKKDRTLAEEICFIEPGDELYAATPSQKISLRQEKINRDLANLDIIIDQTNILNPKYDMLFMYDGIAKENGPGNLNRAPGSETSKPLQKPYIYYDKMKRIQYDVWFLYSVHASLASAMIKAKELISVAGKDSVKLVKNVPLGQYIEIV